MKKIMICSLILIMAVAIIPTSSFAFRGHGGYYYGGRGIYPRVVIYPPCYIAPPPVYVVPASPVYVQPSPGYIPAPNCDQYRTQGERNACQRGLADRQRDAEAQAYQSGRNGYPSNRRW